MWWKLEIAAINNPHLPSGTVNGAVARPGQSWGDPAKNIAVKFLKRREGRKKSQPCTGCTLCNPCTSVPVPLVYGIVRGHQSSPAPRGHHQPLKQGSVVGNIWLMGLGTQRCWSCSQDGWGYSVVVITKIWWAFKSVVSKGCLPEKVSNVWVSQGALPLLQFRLLK